ncbi:HAMP domain-containing histidine kinase [Hymenobacter sp. BT186]|uniref:histidine kinase n=1 Tax=Hymenobacter telluris TaxID=2816474 RepID=A0A939JA49_9BACT|nr:HAMP domain-containing sensor histidine kinase [Hymenobacter telluris]MBO0359499.1 HAMP domain-containing histidine kinase [Hymenobacter telluris]MBW3375525.1 HAMP domain-containing histidine kinase [Hymenobacter norwichensis]
MIGIYDQKSRIKLLIVAVALLIAAATIIYTNILVQRVSEREQEQIALYAKAQRFIINISSEEDSNSNFVFEEIIGANKTIPLVLTDAAGNAIDAKNVNMPQGLSEKAAIAFLRREVAAMKLQHQPIVIELGASQRNYIYYKDSALLAQLRTYPLVQLAVIASLGIIAYFAFSYSRRSEQNRVWVGLAKETAHQLGTPLSSLMAWQSYLSESERFKDEPIVEELGKDIRRLQIITERFSNIGSVPVLKHENILRTTQNAIAYLQSRVSKKVVFEIKTDLPTDTPALVNIPLFDWVIENICKNAVDAMDGRGSITLHLRRPVRDRTSIAIDITDTGKGIPKSRIDRVFLPGYTTKKRGWGLGLALAKRIIENYHKGKLFVKWSEVGRGTTFRLVLKG